MSKSRGSPRKFAEKIALLNKKEAEGTSEFEKILKEVKESTRAPSNPQQYWGLAQRSASFSNWETFGQEPQNPHQQQYSNPNGAQYLSATQHVQYPSYQSQLQQTRQHVINTTRQQSSQGQHLPPPVQQQQRLQPAIYVDRHNGLPDEFMQASAGDQQVARRPSYAKTSPTGPSTQPVSIEVPNIAIFPIDDEYHQQQQQLGVGTLSTTNAATQSTLGDGHFRNDCSNPPISLSRSLPNIANLSVSLTSASQMPPSHPVVDQRLNPAFASSNEHLKQSITTAPLATSSTISTAPSSNTNSNSNNNDCYRDSSRTGRTHNDEYCSLPPFQSQLPAMDRFDRNRQSQSHIPPSDSWQQFSMSSAPSSAAPTPPGGIIQEPHYVANQQRSPPPPPQQQQQQQQLQLVHSPDSSPQRQQQSPQTLHQDYYPSPMQSPLMRASSTNLINKYPDNTCTLETPRNNGLLSKSTDVHYRSYLDNYATNDGMPHERLDGDGSDYHNMDNRYLDVNSSSSPITRSRSENNIENMNSLNDHHYVNQYVDTSQQFLDAPQCQFYE